jgi:hypothetical protein
MRRKFNYIKALVVVAMVSAPAGLVLALWLDQPLWCALSVVAIIFFIAG